MAQPTKPDYGLDAPGVVRNLLLVAGAALLLWSTAEAGLWSGRISFAPSPRFQLVLPISRMVVWPGIACGLMALWMIWDSRIGKVRDREKLLKRITWSGNERVLDVGCGRGLLLVAAAKRLTSGTATGIDIWQSEDLSGNTSAATLTNARLEGVAERVKIETADMRKMPFDDATFDVIVSCAAIHNLYSPADRATALGEIARVLKPNGQALIDDIRHGREYTRVLTTHGFSVQRVSSYAMSLFLLLVTFGSLRPAILLARKTGQ
jgi:SAM-dependent methyltransferase